MNRVGFSVHFQFHKMQVPVPHLPELNASHPHHNTKRPMTALTGVPSGMGWSPRS